MRSKASFTSHELHTVLELCDIVRTVNQYEVLAYICVEHLCSRRPYSMDCHEGAMGEHIQLLVVRKTESVIAMDHCKSVQ